jgi:hypothetical protein
LVTVLGNGLITAISVTRPSQIPAHWHVIAKSTLATGLTLVQRKNAAKGELFTLNHGIQILFWLKDCCSFCRRITLNKHIKSAHPRFTKIPTGYEYSSSSEDSPEQCDELFSVNDLGEDEDFAPFNSQGLLSFDTPLEGLQPHLQSKGLEPVTRYHPYQISRSTKAPSGYARAHRKDSSSTSSFRITPSMHSHHPPARVQISREKQALIDSLPSLEVPYGPVDLSTASISSLETQADLEPIDMELAGAFCWNTASIRSQTDTHLIIADCCEQK